MALTNRDRIQQLEREIAQLRAQSKLEKASFYRGFELNHNKFGVLY